MAAKGGVRVPVVTTVDTKDLAKMTSALDSLKKKVSAQSSGFATLGKSIKGALAIGAVVGLLGKMASEGQQAIAVGRQTANVLKTTGAQAWTSSKQIEALATSLSNKTGVDDEAIQSSANLLLTFKNVINAGKDQAAIFDRATAAALDLSKFGFGDLSSTSKMLGKALNDPTRGITALSKAGVTFNNVQRDQIKAMVKRGDLLGAQQLILKEVESQVKGTAEAMASPMERLQTMFNNLLETAGVPIIGAINKILEALAPLMTQLTPIFDMVGQLVADVITPLIAPLMAIVKSLIPVLQVVISFVGALMRALSPLLTDIGDLVAAFIEALVPALQILLPPILDIIDALVQSLHPIFQILIRLMPSFAGYWAILAAVIGGLVKPLALIVEQGAALFEVFVGPVLQSKMFDVLARQLMAVAVVITKFFVTAVDMAVKATIVLLQRISEVIRGIATARQAFGADSSGLFAFADRLGAAAKGMQKYLDTSNANAKLLGDGLKIGAIDYEKSAGNLLNGAKLITKAGQTLSTGTKSKAPTRKITAPKTIVRSPKTTVGAGSFTVGGTGGGISLSVTVNGSVMQERDIARTIRDELIQFGRRVGKPVALGV